MIRNKDKAKVMTEHILCDCKDKYYNNKKDKYYSKKCYDASIKTILKNDKKYNKKLKHCWYMNRKKYL